MRCTVEEGATLGLGLAWPCPLPHFLDPHFQPYACTPTGVTINCPGDASGCHSRVLALLAHWSCRRSYPMSMLTANLFDSWPIQGLK